MIISGLLTGNTRWLAAHLQSAADNETIELAEMTGTVAQDIDGALAEFDAITAGTRAKEGVYAAFINPPEPLTREQYMRAIAMIAGRLGLEGQPRIVLFHEKEGREHCHVVWSRIDLDRMKAIQLSHTDTINLMCCRHERDLGHTAAMNQQVDLQPPESLVAAWRREVRSAPRPHGPDDRAQGLAGRRASAQRDFARRQISFSLGIVQRALRELTHQGYVGRRQGTGRSSPIAGVRCRAAPLLLRRARRGLPAGLYLGAQAASDRSEGAAVVAIRLDRVIDIGAEFTVASLLYMGAERFGRLRAMSRRDSRAPTSRSCSTSCSASRSGK